MSNIKSIAGASIWMLVSTLLMFAALEPVSTTNGTPASAPGFAQSHTPATPRA